MSGAKRVAGIPAAMPDVQTVQQQRPEKGRPWVLFDGDNTLWHIEALYDRARDNLIAYLRRYGADTQEVEAFQRSEDRRLFAELGYSATRFATSFENSVRRFVLGASAGQIEHARNLALSVFEQPARVDPDAAFVLDHLGCSYNLALITAGERWVQECRVAAFPYASLFDLIRIVESKSAALFRDLAQSLSIDRPESWVIGDSMRSDVAPALEAGLNAVLIANHNWIEVERDYAAPARLHVADTLGGILPIIAASVPARPGQVHS